jgi:O-antigen/teichoic acid export membrane protein
MATLKSQAITGTIWTLLGSGGQQVFAFIIFMVLARTLGAADFGVMAIAAVFIDILSTTTRAGLTEVIIQRQTLNEDTKNTAFWTSVALGLVFTTALFLSAYPLAALFKTPNLAPVMQGLSFIPLLQSFGTVHEGLLRREFGFKTLALRNIFSNLVAGIIAVGMALYGLGVMSLVAQRLIQIILLTGILWASVTWRPKAAFNVRESKSQLATGGALTGANLLGMSNQRVIDLVVGYTLGPVQLGYLRIAWRGLDMLIELGIRPIAQVTLSMFGNLQSNREALARSYLRLSQLTYLITLPAFMGAAMLAPEIIRLMFGPQWEASILPMQILTLTILTFPIIYYKNNALFAVNCSRQVLGLNIAEFLLSFVVVLVSAQFGLIGAALGNVLRVILITPLILWALQKYAGIPAFPMLRQTFPLVQATAAMVAVLALARWLLEPHLSAIPMILTLMPLGALTYAAFLWFGHHAYLKDIVTSVAGGNMRVHGLLKRLRLSSLLNARP